MWSKHQQFNMDGYLVAVQYTAGSFTLWLRSFEIIITLSIYIISILFFFFCSYFSQLLCLWLQHRILQIDIDIIFPNRKYMKYWWKWKDNRIHHHLSYHQMMKMMIVTHHLQKQWEERQVVIKIIKYILKVLVSVFIKR